MPFLPWNWTWQKFGIFVKLEKEAKLKTKMIETTENFYNWHNSNTILPLKYINEFPSLKMQGFF